MHREIREKDFINMIQKDYGEYVSLREFISNQVAYTKKGKLDLTKILRKGFLVNKLV